MCGIAGFVEAASSGGDPTSLLRTMGQAIRSRGPDGSGEWYQRLQDSRITLGFVHRRLAIQDLSESGAQPMTSASGRYVICFNGEVYNFGTLRNQLLSLGASFRGHSDTEVMLAAIEAWGLVESLKEFKGMFAFALYDRQRRELTLARDRMGEKPLYYGWQGRTLLFGSQLEAMRQHPSWNARIDVDAAALFLRHNVVPAPLSIYQGIRKLAPAHYVTFRVDQLQTGCLPIESAYWSIIEASEKVQLISETEATDQLEKLLLEVIEEQMISDVPLGAFLSGGVDSSTVVAMMQQVARGPVRTFSIGFDVPGFNEAVHASRVAKHLGTEHSELYVTPQSALELIPHLPEIYDEPFADSSQIPTFLVSRMAREQVTVALSGDGGDELFYGYPRYQSVLNTWNRRHSASGIGRRWISKLPFDLIAPLLGQLIPGQRHRPPSAIKRRLEGLNRIYTAPSLSEFYRQSVSIEPAPEKYFAKGIAEREYGLNRQLPTELSDSDITTLRWRDLNWYLPDDILAKVDRAAMGCSLETRVPLLDPRVLDFALSLSPELSLLHSEGKNVLRSVLHRHVPREMVERPKQGFAVPIAAWLRGPLREWAEALLSTERLKDQGVWDENEIRSLWSDHQAGEDYSAQLWGHLMFQAWLDHSGASF